MTELQSKGTSTSIDFVPGYRWDKVWQYLLTHNVSKFGPDFRNQLLPELKHRGEITVCHNVQSSEGNRFILVVGDMTGKVHCEFCTQRPEWISYHAFMLAMQYVQQVLVSEGDCNRGYMLPPTYILDLQGVLKDGQMQFLHLYSPGFTTDSTLNFRVIRPEDRISALKAATECKTLRDARKYARDLYSVLSGGMVIPERQPHGAVIGGVSQEEINYFRNCAALMDPEVWTTNGTTHAMVDLLTTVEDELSESTLDSSLFE